MLAAKEFPNWLIQNDIVDHVPLSVPSVHWIHPVLQRMTEVAAHWDTLRAAQQSNSYSAMFAQDWARRGKRRKTDHRFMYARIKAAPEAHAEHQG